MKRLLTIIAALIILSGCGSKNKEFPYGVFPDSVTVAPSKVVELAGHNVLKNCGSIRYKGWLFFVDDYTITHNCIKAVSEDFTKTLEAVNRGNGPCDISESAYFFYLPRQFVGSRPQPKKIIAD